MSRASFLVLALNISSFTPFFPIQNLKLLDRYREEKPAALAYFAFKPNFAPMHLHEFLCQRKSEAGSLRLSGVTARLLKFEEDVAAVDVQVPAFVHKALREAEI